MEEISEKDEIQSVGEEKRKDTKLRGLVITAIGGTVGGSIYVILGGAINIAGSGAIISLILLGILIIFLVMNYSELSLSIPILGGGYSFSKEAIGGFWGFIIGWLMWFGNITYAALSGIGFGYSLAIFFPNRIGIQAHFIPLIGFLIILVFCILNSKGNPIFKKIMRSFSYFLVFGFIFYVCIGLGLGPLTNSNNFKISNLNWEFNFQNIIPIFIVSPILIGIFCLYEWNSAFESITAKIDEIKQSRKKVLGAFFIAIAIAIILYILVTLTTIINMGENDGIIWNFISNSRNPLADTLDLIIGDFGLYLIAFAGMICTMTSIQAAVQMSYRIFYAMVRDGYLPKVFKKNTQSEEIPLRSKIPSFTIILFSTLMIQLNFLIDISNFAILLSMSLLCFSVILLRKRRPFLNRPYKIKIFPWIPLLSGCVCLLLVIAINPYSLIQGIVLLIVGIMIYSFSIARRDRIKLILTGTKIGASLLMIFFLIVTRNEFIGDESILGQFLEKIDGFPLIIAVVFIFITVIFDLKPLGLIFRQIAKQKDNDALIVSDLVEIPDQKKKLIFRINVAMFVGLLLIALISFMYVFFVMSNTLDFNDFLFDLDSNSIGLLGISIMIINGIVMVTNSFIGIVLQVELKKANI